MQGRPVPGGRCAKTEGAQGAALVELAVCLPVLLVLVLGAIECTSMTYLQNSIQIVAYESVRSAIRSDATLAQVQSRANQVISERALKQTSVVVNPADPQQVQAGDLITVTVTAQTAANSVMRLQFFGPSLTASAAMVKE